MDHLQPPNLRPDFDDFAKSIVKSVTGQIPVIGGVTSELMSYWKSSIDERLEAFYKNLINAVNYLNERDKSLVDRLKSDKAFVSFLIEVREAYQKNHEQGKYSYFENTMANYPLIQIPYDRKKRFVTLASELSLNHIDILKMINAYKNNRHIVLKNNRRPIF